MTRRLLLGTVLALAVLAAPLSAAAASGDTTAKTAGQQAMEYASAAKLLLADGSGSFRPNDLMTRQELIDMTMRRVYPNRDFSHCFRWIAPSLPIKYTKLFSDVLITDPAAEELCGAMVTGLISGQPDGSFRPQTEVSLSEAAKVVTRGFGIYQFGRIDPPSFAWYIQYTDPLVERHALPEGLTPQDARQKLSRSQVSEIFYALKDEAVTPDARPTRSTTTVPSRRHIVSKAMERDLGRLQ